MYAYDIRSSYVQFASIANLRSTGATFFGAYCPRFDWPMAAAHPMPHRRIGPKVENSQGFATRRSARVRLFEGAIIIIIIVIIITRNG